MPQWDKTIPVLQGEYIKLKQGLKNVEETLKAYTDRVVKSHEQIEWYKQELTNLENDIVVLGGLVPPEGSTYDGFTNEVHLKIEDEK